MRQIWLRCLVWSTVLAAAVPAPGQRVGSPPPLLPEPVVAALAEEVSGSEAHDIVQELTLHHRMRVSAGIRAAAAAIVRRASDYGLDQVELLELPADGEVFYGTQRSRPAWEVERAELWELRQRQGEWIDDRRVGSWESRPLSLAQDSASGSLSAGLVDVGQGTSAADYEGKEVAGKLVLAAAQPGAVARIAVRELGAAGIVSYAQNQKSAWWGENRNLTRWGHMETFPEPEAFGFMVTVNQAQEWQRRLADGEKVQLRAVVEARQ